MRERETLFLISNVFFVIDEDDEKWLSKLNTCKWLKYVSKTLHGAASLAKLLNFRNIELAGKKRERMRRTNLLFFEIRK